MKIERYGIYLADLNPIRGAEMGKTRPVVVISDNGMNASLKTVVICPLTTKVHAGWRSRITVNCAGTKAEIAVDQIRSISKDRLVKRIDALSPTKAQELRAIITEMYGE